MNNIQSKTPFLRTSRKFPFEGRELPLELDRAYIDIANAVNARTIGIFPSNAPAVTGESWFIENQKQQTLRKAYSFGTIAPGTEMDIPIGILTGLVSFTRIYGTVVTNAIDYRPLPYATPTGLNQQIALLVGTVAGQLQIRIVVGAGSPTITSGIVVLEYLSNV